jgi:hypothetical protein
MSFPKHKVPHCVISWNAHLFHNFRVKLFPWAFYLQSLFYFLPSMWETKFIIYTN